MPVRVVPSEHSANAVFGGWPRFSESPLELLHESCSYTQLQPLEILQSSFDEASSLSTVKPSSNGLVFSLIHAYSRHHHLQLRPDDIWFAILTQFCSFANAHPRRLRSNFVEHEGQKELEVKFEKGDRWTVDQAQFVLKMGQLIEDNVIDPGIRAWMTPGFSTTSKQDEVIAGIIMMGTLQKYFSYTERTMCGIPSVTLLGEKEDWEKLLLKVDVLDGFGDEPAQFTTLLRPVLRRFVRSFDDPSCEEVVDFWQRVVDVRQRSGDTKYSGWVTAFCFWDKDGKRIKHAEPEKVIVKDKDVGASSFFNYDKDILRLNLDGVHYHHVKDEDVPAGWTSVPVRIIDGLKEINAEMIAGSVGQRFSSNGISKDGETLDTIRPETGWWMFEKTGEAKSPPFWMSGIPPTRERRSFAKRVIRFLKCS